MNIIITGASRGIGKCIALYFADQGWDIGLCSRDPEALQLVCQEIRSRNPGCRILSLPTDMGKKAAVQQFGREVGSFFNSVDILVNNAGLFLPGTLMAEPDGQLEDLISVHLYGAYYLCRELIPAMIRKGQGHIINICSVASLKAYPNGGSYAIAKAALLGFSRNLREELRSSGIRVSALCPGATLTDSWSGSRAAPDRFMLPEDIAELIWDLHHLHQRVDVEEIILRPLAGDL